MPILNSILDHEVIGLAIRQGLKQGGSHIIRRQLENRFGKLPDWAELRLAALSAGNLDEIAVRILSAKNLPDVFQKQ